MGIFPVGSSTYPLLVDTQDYARNREATLVRLDCLLQVYLYFKSEDKLACWSGTVKDS